MREVPFLNTLLGDEVRVTLPPDEQPTYVMQYFTEPKALGGVDPRQHAIGLTYCLPVEGPVHAQGEAIEFAWFDLNELPSSDEFGFNQDRVVAECLRRLGINIEIAMGHLR